MAAKRKQPGKRKGLTAQQRKFAREYAKTGVGQTAAIKAGYSKDTATSQASRLLTKVNVVSKVAALVEEADFDAIAVLRELARIASADIGEAFDDNGRLKPIHQIPVHIRRAMSGIEVEEAWGPDGEGGRMPTGDVKKVKFWDKPKALDLLAKHHGLITEKVEHSLSKSFEDLIRESYEEPAPPPQPPPLESETEVTPQSPLEDEEEILDPELPEPEEFEPDEPEPEPVPDDGDAP